jgi:hypothetical protein
MGPADYKALVFAVAACIALIRYRLEVARAIEALIDQFRGGPPTPMHPSPAGDHEYLRRRSRENAR